MAGFDHNGCTALERLRPSDEASTLREIRDRGGASRSETEVIEEYTLKLEAGK